MTEVKQSELAVSGALLLDGGLIDSMATYLSAEDFTQERCATIYKAVSDARGVFDAGDAVNILTLCMGQEAASAFVTSCMDVAPVRGMVEHHARVVHDAAQDRRLRVAVDAAMLESDGAELAERLAGIAQKYMEKRTGAAHTMLTALKDVVVGLEHSRDGVLYTGFHRLDGLLKGLYPGQLVIIGARPAVGKSAFALALALNVARSGKVVFFSQEMTAKEIAQRGIVTRGSITLDELLEGDAAAVAKRIVDPAGELSKLCPIVIDDRPGLTLAQLRARVRQHTDARLVLVDYIGLMQTTRRDGSRNLELGELVRGLKVFAQEAGVPIVALSQLNRGTDDTERPSLRSLRDSGEIEQHADKVLLMWRSSEDMIAVDVAKNRNGRTGIVQYEFDGGHMTFRESCLKYEEQQRRGRGFL